MKHSLWIELPQLQPVVDELAADTDNPSFTPHLTLGGNLKGSADKLIDKLSPRAQKLKSFQLPLANFDTKGEEWRYFCLMAKLNPGLKKFFAHVHELFPDLAPENFIEWPHVSLLYGTPSARQRYPSIGPLMHKYGSALNEKYPVTTLALWQTAGPVESWQQVKVWAL